MVITWRFAVLCALLAVPVCIVQTWQFLLAAVAALIAAALIDAVLSPSCRAVALQRTPGPSVRLGGDAYATLTIRNDSRRRLRLHVRDAWAPSAGAVDNRFSVSLAPGESTERHQKLTPVRRGVLKADSVTLRSFTFARLAGRQKSIPVPAELRVTPPFQSRRHLASKMQRLREFEGRTALMTHGAGTEFDSLKDYVRGDDVRSMDWRATARAQKPIVRTWRPERERRVVIVIDSSRLSARLAGTGTVYDAQVEAALLLISLAAGAGDRVEVLIADARVRLMEGPLMGRHPVGRLMERLAGLEPELIDADWSAIVSAAMAVAPNRSLFVLLTPLDPLTLAQDILPSVPVMKAKHTIAVASVSDPELRVMSHTVYSASQVFQAAVAAQELLDEESSQRSLTSLGIHTVSAPPEDLPPTLADLYISLKAGGKV